MNGLSFERAGQWPILLLLPPLWGVFYAVLKARARAVRRYGAASKDVVPTALGRSLRLASLCLLGAICWLDPRYGEEVLPVERRGLDLVFCLDTSRSMLARDAEPNRLERAKNDIRSILPLLGGGDRVALVVFSGQARLWIPLTHDLPSFAALLDEADTTVVPVGGTDLAAALNRARETLQSEAAATSVVVLLTDGEDLAEQGQEAAKELAASSVRVHAVGYGSMYGSKITIEENGTQAFLRGKDGEEVVSQLDVAGLRAIAEASGGEFVRADAMALPLRQLHEKRILPMHKRAFDAAEEVVRKPRYQWVLLPLLLLLLHEMRTAKGRAR